MAKIGLSSPWDIFYKEINELFKEDPEIQVVYNEDAKTIKLYVDNDKKANALSQILPDKKEFGNVTIYIEVVPANGITDEKISLFQAAFEGNPAVSYFKTIKGVFANNISYVVFENKVVQYFNDDLGDIHGLCSTLYQEIAKDVFGEVPGVFFCTDVE